MSRKNSILLGIIFVIIVGGIFAFNLLKTKPAAYESQAKNKVNSSKSFSKNKTLSVTPTLIPTEKPVSYAPVQPQFTPTPANYENYGWYMHDGKSMQYFNGSWFTTPQQANTPTPTPTPTQAPCPPEVPGYYCSGWCQHKTSEECKKDYDWQWQQQVTVHQYY